MHIYIVRHTTHVMDGRASPPLSASLATADQQQQGADQQQQTAQLLAYQRKYDEELEGFKKLAARLQAQAASSSSGAVSGSPEKAGSQLLQQQVPDSVAGSCPEQAAPWTDLQAQLAAAIQAAEALLAEVHAAAVAALSSGAAAENQLLAKQLRLQRNQAFEAAKALLHKAAGPGGGGGGGGG